jgi:glutamyl-tRNA(Gln) amidotransferase subunit E
MSQASSPGLKVGLEIHQQLDTGKLFCRCRCELSEDEAARFVRRLRPKRSEMGELDGAAILEASKDLEFEYIASKGTCLVEADEEPPHEINPEAVRAALTTAAMLDARPVDEIHVMRKIVIDGSNTSGFQRTALIAANGKLAVNGKSIGIQSICLEEDAARKIRATGSMVTYRLDRLGIPLIEIATDPSVSSPEEAREVALAIGMLLRATRKVKRGIGSIREDLNISIPGGARVEIKGVQELGAIERYVNEETERQQRLIWCSEKIKERKAGEPDGKIFDLTDIFSGTGSKIISKSLKDGGRVLGLKLTGFSGLLGIRPGDTSGKRILGPELAQRARALGVKGLFHSDELPAYGITEDEVKDVKKNMAMGELDAFVFIAEKEGAAKKALDSVLERARLAPKGVPEETRDPQPDCTSAYSRPLPGKARMYPETDVPPFRVPGAYMDEVRKSLPETFDETVSRLTSDYKVSRQQAEILTRSEWLGDFEDTRAALETNHLDTVLAKTYTDTFSELAAKGVDLYLLAPHIQQVFEAVREGDFSKEAIPGILEEIARSKKGLAGAISALGLETGAEKPEDTIRRIVEERAEFVKEKGSEALGPLMGPVMAELRGKLDGKEISEILKKEIERIIGSTR